MGVFDKFSKKKEKFPLPSREEGGVKPTPPPDAGSRFAREEFHPSPITPMRPTGGGGDHSSELVLAKLELLLQKVQVMDQRLQAIEKIAKESQE